MDAAGVAYGKPTRNVVVRNLVVGRTHALSVGSEMSGGVANVLFQVMLERVRCVKALPEAAVPATQFIVNFWSNIWRDDTLFQRALCCKACC